MTSNGKGVSEVPSLMECNFDTASIVNELLNTQSNAELSQSQVQESFYTELEAASPISIENGLSVSSSTLELSSFNLATSSSQNCSSNALAAPDKASDLHYQTPVKKQRSNGPLSKGTSKNDQPTINISDFTCNDPANKYPLIQNNSTDSQNPALPSKKYQIDAEQVSETLEAATSQGPSKFKLTISFSQDHSNESIPNTEWTYKGNTGQELLFNPNTSLLFEHLYNTNSKLKSTVRMKLPDTGRKYEIRLHDMNMTEICSGEKMTLFRRSWNPEVPRLPDGLQSGLSVFPSLWSPQENDIQLVKLERTTDEFSIIKDTFQQTLPNKRITRIDRIQNKKLYIRYAFQKALLLDNNSESEKSLNEKLLFHGTRQTPPNKIWESQDGFDLRCCRPGMWGIGAYFAENASYSDHYGYNGSTLLGDKYHEMFVANVLTGNSIEMESSTRTREMKRPPVYLQATTTYMHSGTPEVLYDSVTGITKGSRIYVLYKLDMAYPSYLVRYS